MVHPDTELRLVNEIIGYGVFATKLIPKGTITWVRDQLDQAFSPQQIASMPASYRNILDKYTFVDAQGMHVLCWDISRFINHSCNANCLSAGYDFEIAVRDILPGEELTDDYGTLNLRAPFECACGLASCRKWILPEDMEHHSDHWDQAVRQAFPHIARHAQPLWEFMREKPEIEAALKDSTKYRSIRWNYSPPEAIVRA